MSLGHLVEFIAGHHLIPALLAAAVMFLGLSAAFAPGRLLRPADRVLFLYAALTKALIAAWAGESVSCLASQSKQFGYLQFRLPDLVPDGFLFESLTSTGYSLDSYVLTAIVVAAAALGLLCYRWARLAPVYRGIYESRHARPRDFPAAFQTFADLASKAYLGSRWLPRPRLVIIQGSPCPAFTMGVRPPVIVLSAELVSGLGARELAAILAHELAHVRRLDYVGRWVATILTDILIWNPCARLWYQQLVEHQEKASDAWAAEQTGDPVGVASSLVEMGAYARELPLVSVGPLAARGRRSDFRLLEERVDCLLEGTRRSGRRSRWATGAVYLGLCGFLAAQPHIVLSLPDLWAGIRHIF